MAGGVWVEHESENIKLGIKACTSFLNITENNTFICNIDLWKMWLILFHIKVLI